MKTIPYNILLSPHPDDETLYAAYTIMRKSPLIIVCTDVYLHKKHNITPEQRILETLDAMSILGGKVIFLHIKDTELTEEILIQKLNNFSKPDLVYAPAIQEGHEHHDLVGYIAKELYDNVIHYATYTKDSLSPVQKGNKSIQKEIKPTLPEMELKNRALDCYKSQLKINKPHFDAVRNQPEYYV